MKQALLIPKSNFDWSILPASSNLTMLRDKNIVKKKKVRV